MLREKLWTIVDQYEKPFKVGLYLMVILLMAGIIWVRAAAPPDTISYQGYLTDTSGRAVSGTFDMSVAFWDAASGGANPYTESHANVTVTRGQFDLELGAGTTSDDWGALDFSQALWMEITANGETFAPRIPFSAVPYARFAFQSQQIGTLASGNWCTSDGNVINCNTGSAVSGTEFGYLDGVSSAIQTQLDGKAPTITGSATTIDTESLTSSRALISNASSKVAVSAVTDTELGYLDGVSSAIQTQLDSKGSGDFTDVNAGTGLSVSAGSAAGPSVTLAADATYLQRRVTGTCAAGSSIRIIAEDGTVTCETDDTGGGSITAKVGVSNATTPQPLQSHVPLEQL